MVSFLKLIDKFLKLLKTDRNTFVTFILSIISIYILVDRLLEILLIIFTGISYSYWGPIKYTLAIACVTFAFFFSSGSKFAKADINKLRIFNVFIVSFYIVCISALVQWLNMVMWLGVLSLPNFAELASNFSHLFKPAFTAIGLYIPLVTFYKLFKWLAFTINDTKDIRDSIFDYPGIDLSGKSEQTGNYTCEVKICMNTENGLDVFIPESKRFESLLVVGVSGSGKTATVYEPMIARDFNKKFFFREIAKEMGFTALKTGLGSLTHPYSNDYLSKNFSLNMITPNEDKMDLFKSYMKKMIVADSGNKIVYKDLGVTYVAPDPDTIETMAKVADNFGLHANIIDPNNPNSIGLNPFASPDPIKTGITISTVLKGLFAANRPDIQLAFRENAAIQILENLSILLKEMYPILHDGNLPNLEDLLNMMNDFSLVQEMTEQMKQIPELADKYRILIRYMENNFYENGADRENTKKSIFTASTELDNLLRYPGIKNILCNRNNNLNFDQSLENGEITLVCTRRGDLGPNANKAFGLFFLLLIQQSILTRPGNDKTRIPHFLYIDTFPQFICKATEPIFTVYRKYKVGTILDAQALSQLEGESDPINGKHFRDTILSNCINKIIFGNALPEDTQYWEKEMQDKREWGWTDNYQSDPANKDYGYDSKKSGIKYKWVPNFGAGKIKSLKAKQVIYKVKDIKGKSEVDKGKVDTIDPQFKEKQKIREYNFAKFTSGISSDSKEKEKRQRKNSFLSSYSNSNNNEEDDDAIKIDNSDAKFLFDNEDAIIVNLKKGNPNN